MLVYHFVLFLSVASTRPTMRGTPNGPPPTGYARATSSGSATPPCSHTSNTGLTSGMWYVDLFLGSHLSAFYDCYSLLPLRTPVYSVLTPQPLERSPRRRITKRAVSGDWLMPTVRPEASALDSKGPRSESGGQMTKARSPPTPVVLRLWITESMRWVILCDVWLCVVLLNLHLWFIFISLFQAVISEKECIIYTWGPSSAYKRAFFSDNFISDVREMSKYEQPTRDDPDFKMKRRARRRAGQKFIRTYGTHIFNEVSFGSAIRIENFYKVEKKEAFSEGSAEKCHEKAVSACASASLGIRGLASIETELCASKNFKKCLENNSTNGVRNNVLRTHFSNAYLGAIYEPNMAGWVERTKLSPRVVSATVTPMEDILIPEHFTESIAYRIRGFINITNALGVFKQALAHSVFCPPPREPLHLYRIFRQEDKCVYLN